MITIRRAYPTDAYSIVEVNLEVWKSEYNDILPSNIIHNMSKNMDNKVKHLKDQIEENNRILVAVDEDKVIGFIFYAKSKNEAYSKAAEIRALYILEDYQRKGIGTELFYKAVDEVKKLGFQSLILTCPVKNKNNDFFIKLGGTFKEVTSFELSDCLVDFNVIYYDLMLQNSKDASKWQDLYTQLVSVGLSITVNHGTIALVESSGCVYFGLNVLKMVTALEVAISNMKMDSKDKVDRIILINNDNELVIPNGNDLELLLASGNGDAFVLVDISTMEVKQVRELISSYKKEERV